MNVIAVGIGGFLGAIIRYLEGRLILPVSGFPVGTLVINLVGCLFLAWFLTVTTSKWKINQNIKLAIGTGFTGAYTTFSTFSVETLHLLKNHQYLFASLYVLSSILGGIALAFLGVKLALKSVHSAGETKGDLE